MSALRLLLGDQISESISALDGADKERDTIMLCEVMEEAQYVRHHPKKIAFLFAAMRHFGEHLKHAGYHVRYVALNDPANSGSLNGEVARALKDTQAQTLVLTEPGEWRVNAMYDAWRSELPVAVEIRHDSRFLCSIRDFMAWAGDKKQLRMEFFYREMRKRHNILMNKDGTPAGGKWNYDAENRKSPPKGLTSPPRLRHKKDAITDTVLALVSDTFPHHFGDLHPFNFAVTREQALEEADHFITELLPHFGDYQDAMVNGEAYLFHSLLSCYLNAGLLLPLELCRMAESAFLKGNAPLNAAEGYIRQILGWREYVRGIYWRHMPDYVAMNTLKAHEKLPAFYWGAPTGMACIAEAVSHTKQHAYSHHIQRLMVTGNFALLAGIDVSEVHEWYLAVYADAYEWVEAPNTIGMALHADGGIMASKPYAASGKYIQRMSNFCANCRYDPEKSTGDDACPFNALYWHFLAKHEARFRSNQRMPYVYANWNKFSSDKRGAILQQAESVLARMREGTL